MDTIVIRDLRVEVLIGIYKREHYVPQTVSIDLDIGIPGDAVFASDKVADTIDYAQVAIKVKALGASQHFRLVETFAERIAKLLTGDFKAPWGESDGLQNRHTPQRQVRRRLDRAGVSASARAPPRARLSAQARAHTRGSNACRGESRPRPACPSRADSVPHR